MVQPLPPANPASKAAVKPAEKKESMSTMQLIGIGLLFLGFILLGVGIVLW